MGNVQVFILSQKKDHKKTITICHHILKQNDFENIFYKELKNSLKADKDLLKSQNIYDLFDYIVGADQVENDKPDPEMIFKTADELNVDLKNIVMVGDSIVDMEMGRRAVVGLVVGVLEGGVATRKDLEKDADIVINSVRNIKLI